MSELKRCSRCVMDNASDSTISFDHDGRCNYCNYAYKMMGSRYFPNEEGRQRLGRMVAKLKQEGRGSEYDCLMGLSGGLDSSYLLYLGFKHGLRILAVHVDDGFNTETCESNIRRLVKYCNIDLHVEQPDREQYMDLVRSFMVAGVPGIAIPQDNIILASLYRYARTYRVKYILSGANFALESVLERSGGANNADKRHILAIGELFGRQKTDRLRLVSLIERYILNRYLHGIVTLRPLDYIDYDRDTAIEELQEFCGFDYCGGKHYESVLTHFAQTYYLPEKFGVDKRKSHLSSLIVSGQMTREEALGELDKPVCDRDMIERDIDLILNSTQMSKTEFDEIMKEQPRKHHDYPMSMWMRYAPIARKFRKYLSD